SPAGPDQVGDPGSPRSPGRCTIHPNGGMRSPRRHHMLRSLATRRIAMTDAKHVVIVGGGFAGLGCARKLAGRDDIRVTLIDKHNYHQFQPLFYQVATCQLASADVATSLRKPFRKHPNVAVKMGEVAAVDPATKQVTLDSGQTIQGDFLVLAAGSQPNF